LQAARERGWLLAWDSGGALTLLDFGGTEVGGIRLTPPVTAVACADDGSAIAAVAGQRLLFLGADLAVRWEQSPPGVSALAVEAFGQYLAVALTDGGLNIMDRRGQVVSSTKTPRPLRFLGFAAERPLLIGSADFGLVVCCDLRGRWFWRDGLVAHVGSLDVCGSGLAALACFSDGLVRYGPEGGKQPPLSVGFVRRASLSYDGGSLLTLGQGKEVRLRHRNGTVLGEWEADAEPIGLFLDALGRRAALAFADGRVRLLDTERRAGAVGP
jgi:hypothetical protein